MGQSGQLADFERWAALSLLRLGPDTRAARLFKDLSLASGLSKDTDAMGRLADALGLAGPSRAERIALAAARGKAATAAAVALRLTLLTPSDRRYPSLLGEIPDPPIVLWVAGTAEVLTRPAVAIVGSRYATAAGMSIAASLGRELAEAGLTVVSGLARGIDGAAHQGALNGGGLTVAVLGSGVDTIYPPEHLGLAAAIEARGCVLSEFPPGTRPLAHHFPLRNRIISGLCRAVVVVEASEKSGSLITARAALEQGRDVLAVPGNIAGGRYRGGHALIKDGARLVETVDDILDELGWSRAPDPATGDDPKSPIVSRLLTTIGDSPAVTVDELAARTGRPAADLLAELGALEVVGAVKRVPGGGFART
jgi:DNA processing protein